MNVSVIIPCHNAEPYLAQAVRSALDQSVPPHEVIIVNDGSTDASLDIALWLRETEGDRVRVISEASGVAPRTRNLGAAAATADALMFLDADDVVGPDTLAALIAALRSGQYGVAICPWYRLDLAGDRWVMGPPSCKPLRQGQDALSGWLTGWYHPPCSVMWTRDGFERAGRWEERWSTNDDGDLMMRALVLGVPLANAASGAGYYRRISSGGTLSGERFTERGLESRIRTICKIAALLEDQGRVDRYGESLAVAFDRIAADSGQHPDIAARCAALRDQYRPSRLGRFSWFDSRAGYFKRANSRARRQQRGGTGLRTHTEAVEAGVRSPLYVGVSGRQGEPEFVRRPAVSVVLPTFQRAHLLPRALESVLAQSFADFELIIVDDGSTDGTADVVAGCHDERIRYLVQPENRGVSAARNRGLRAVRADLIAFLDSDDEWLPTKLEQQVARMESVGEDVGLLYGGVENVQDGGSVRLKVPRHRGDVYRVLLLENVLHGTSGVMMRRSVVATAGFFDEGIPAIEDYDYWVRAARFFRVESIDAPLIRYHEGSGEERKSLAVQDNHKAREWFFRKHRSEMRREGLEHKFLVETARRYLERSGDTGSARRAAVRAALCAPLAPEVRRMLFSTFVYEPLRRSEAARAVYRRVPWSTR